MKHTQAKELLSKITITSITSRMWVADVAECV